MPSIDHGSGAWRRGYQGSVQFTIKDGRKEKCQFRQWRHPIWCHWFYGMVDDSNDVIADSSTSLNTWKILSSENRVMSSRTTFIAIQAHTLGSYMDRWWWPHHPTWHHHLFRSAGDGSYLPYDIYSDICNVHNFTCFRKVSLPYRPNCYILIYDIPNSAYRCDRS